MNIKGVLRKRIASFILAGTMSGSILGVLPVNVDACEAISTIETNSEKTLTSNFYETQERAEIWINDNIKALGQDIEINDVKLYLYKGYSKKVEKIEVDEIFETKNELLLRLTELENISYFNCNFVINENKEIKKLKNTIEINNIFYTKKDLKEYINFLKSKENVKIKLIEKNNSGLVLLNNVFQSKLNKPMIIEEKDNIYRLIGTYDDIKEIVTIRYNLKGVAYKTIREDRYQAEITYKYCNNKGNNVINSDETDSLTNRIEEKNMKVKKKSLIK